MITITIFVIHVKENTILFYDEYFAAKPKDCIQFFRAELLERLKDPLVHILIAVFITPEPTQEFTQLFFPRILPRLIELRSFQFFRQVFL